MNCFSNCNTGCTQAYNTGYNSGCISPDTNDNCCNANNICNFDGDMSNVVCEPIYVQKIYDAVLLNLQGLKTVSDQHFTPAIPSGFRIAGISEIRCKKFFNPANINDPSNAKISANTTISGASFVNDSNGEVCVIGADGTLSERLLYADTYKCDEDDKGTPIFGTQKVCISGHVIITLDLILTDNFGREVCFPVTANVNIASPSSPLLLTSFFEMCMPSVYNTAFLPRFTEICNVSCETRLATNSFGRDLTVNANGEVSANLIIALCVQCEKKIIVPVELCVLSTGFVQLSPNTSNVCSNFPQLFPNQINASEDEVAGDTDEICENGSGPAYQNQPYGTCCDPFPVIG
jgi:hypothetical protein